MQPTIVVKSADNAVKMHRQAIAQRVVAHFGSRLPGASLLCFFDDSDWEALRADQGPANRGAFAPVIAGDRIWEAAPPDLFGALFRDRRAVFENLVYYMGAHARATAP